MKIRKSRSEDLERMLRLYADARVFMAEHGNPTQWANGYPEPEMLQEDIRAGVSYVCEDDQGRVVGTFVFFVGEDESYKVIEQGDWKDHRVPYGVVHRITSQRGEGAPRGVGSFCLQWCFEQCGNVRIDTHRDNLPMQRALAKNGFERCGIVYVRGGEERIAFQKVARS